MLVACWSFLFLITGHGASALAPSTGHRVRTTRTEGRLSAIPTIDGLWKSLEERLSDGKRSNQQEACTSPGAGFFRAVNDKNIDGAMAYIASETESTGVDFYFEDTDFPSAFGSPQELERVLRLQSEIGNAPIVVIDEDIYDASARKSGVAFHLEDPQKQINTKGAAFFELNDDGLIRKAFIVKENDKSGESSLKILKLASDVIAATKEGQGGSSSDSVPVPTLANPSASVSLPEQYFAAWNQRDMKQAVSVFAQDIEYDDTAFPAPFSGKEALENHLDLCAEAMPPSFSFIVDDKIDAGNKVMVRWHVESNAEELPYTRGCSHYRIENELIASGTDLKEPAVFKTGGLMLFIDSFSSKLRDEPIRMVPTLVWATYMYVVFFSDWFYGLPATSLEVRTWEEVRDLSLNFFLVSPILDLPFAPVVHPGLEGIFNLLLSWAAMFAGFLSDDRKSKPNLFPMLPAVAGMQFLTSAFLLPYLATRSVEDNGTESVAIPAEEITPVIKATDSKILGLAMGLVGTGSIAWGLFARFDDFGDISTRYASLIDLLSIDRVGSSFLVDLAIFGLFQGWLVEDDAKRRGMDPDSLLAKAAKYVPFFGLVSYLTLRPGLVAAEEQR
ncbi:unnamed protein product [Pseudo-nitzschia multistriata]|uniref:SnoaL-like domain-containing protein n=1 Tax=Pseudo-nitzschia multistriata TaxID=183589 RepID=A0A448YW91_9STRA|nr:unnamed protein product [Pseudo-nitzschia multistriata]